MISLIAGKSYKKGEKGSRSSRTTTTSQSSRISTMEINMIIEDLQHNQHRDSTRRNYLAVWKLFNEFFVRLDNKPSHWEDRLNLFVGYLVKNNRRSAMVKSYISAIKAVLNMNNIRIEEDRYLLASLVKVCRLKNDCIKTRLPIQRECLTLSWIRFQNIIKHSPSWRPYTGL